jgi:hypothetical protein
MRRELNCVTGGSACGISGLGQQQSDRHRPDTAWHLAGGVPEQLDALRGVGEQFGGDPRSVQFEGRHPITF